MIIYNVTCSIETDIINDWLEWMEKEHVPEVMNTGIFIEAQINRVISDDKSGLVTYAIQYLCREMKDLHMYQSNFAPSLQKKHSDRYGSKVIAFRTLLEVINKF